MMNDVPRDHRRGSIPVGLLGMIVLVTTIELGVMRGNLDFMDNVALSWKYTGKIVKRKAKGNAILCFGDSMLKFGLMPRVITERTGQKSYNLAVLCGSAPSSYYLLRRALDTGARPSSVIVDYARPILGDEPGSVTRPFPWIELLDSREAAELCWTAKDPNLATSIGLRWVLHSVRQRQEIRAHVLAKLSGTPTGQRDNAPALWRNWNQNQGGQANTKVKPFDEVVIPKNHPIKAGTWRCDPVNEVYVHKFIELAQRHNIKVFWMLPPVTPGVFSHWVHSGDEMRYIDFVRQQQSRFPGLVVLDARDSGYERSLFVDGVHLDRDGAGALSYGVAQALRKSISEPGETRSTWIPIQTVGESSPRIAIEDIAESRRALRGIIGQKARQ